MVAEYVPGKCNIGARGRAMRLATGVGIIAVLLVLAIFVLGAVSWVFRFVLFLPFYVGFLAVLEGSMSFCDLHTARGTYDLHEAKCLPLGSSPTKVEVGSEEWKILDRRKAHLMHLEAVAGALALALLLAFA